MARKKKEIQYISEFDNHKKICQLNKPHSPRTLLFCTEDLPDEWLIDVVEYKTKSGEMLDTYYITSKEMPEYIKFMGKAGFTKITNF